MAEPFHQILDVADDLNEVARVQEAVSSLWETRELPPELEPVISLAVEEVLSNVLRHSRNGGRSCEIRVALAVADGWFEFEVSDSAPEYDPLARPDPDVAAPLSERRPGGLGVFLVKRLADEVAYRREDGRNRLRFRKALAPARSQAQCSK